MPVKEYFTSQAARIDVKNNTVIGISYQIIDVLYFVEQLKTDRCDSLANHSARLVFVTQSKIF